ncbi:hypothetical protein ACLOJK_008399 [Asimina triloba]
MSQVPHSPRPSLLCLCWRLVAPLLRPLPLSLFLPPSPLSSGSDSVPAVPAWLLLRRSRRRRPCFSPAVATAVPALVNGDIWAVAIENAIGRLNIPRHMLPQTDHPTALSVLRTDNPTIVNVLVDQNISEIYLHVQTNNEDVINFYKKFGFEITDTIQNYYTNIFPPDCYVLTKFITLAQPKKRVGWLWSFF